MIFSSLFMLALANSTKFGKMIICVGKIIIRVFTSIIFYSSLFYITINSKYEFNLKFIN